MAPSMALDDPQNGLLLGVQIRSTHVPPLGDTPSEVEVVLGSLLGSPLLAQMMDHEILPSQY